MRRIWLFPKGLPARALQWQAGHSRLSAVGFASGECRAGSGEAGRRYLTEEFHRTIPSYPNRDRPEEMGMTRRGYLVRPTYVNFRTLVKGLYYIMNFVFHLPSMLEDLLNAGAIIVGSPAYKLPWLGR